MKQIFISALFFFQTSLFSQTLFTGDKKELDQQVLLKSIPSIKVWDKAGKEYVLPDYIKNNQLHNGKAFLIIQWGPNHGTIKERMNEIHSKGLADQFNIIALYTGLGNTPEKLIKAMTEDLELRQAIDNNWAKFIILATNGDEVKKNFFFEDYPNFIYADSRMSVITISKVGPFESTKKLLEGIQNGIIKKSKKWYSKETGEVSEADPGAFYYIEYLLENKILHFRFGTKTKLLSNVNYVIQGDQYLYHGLFEAKNEAGQKTALGTFKEGIPVETFKSWYDDGKTLSIYPVNGTYKVFANNGKLIYEGPIENGLGNGLFTEYDTSGKKVSETNYKAGKVWVKKENEVITSKEIAEEGSKKLKESPRINLPDTLLLPFHEHMAAFRIKNKWGFINEDGKIIIPAQYDSVGYFSEGMASYYKGSDRNEKGKLEGGKWGFIDMLGNIKIPPKYYSVKQFAQGLASARMETSTKETLGWTRGRSGYINMKGVEVINLEYFTANDFLASGVATVEDPDLFNSTYKLINKEGVVLAKYKKIESIGEGLFTFLEEGKGWGVMDSKGKIITEVRYQKEVTPFADGMAIVSKHKSGSIIDEKYEFGFIDKTGKEVIPAKYGAVGDFSEGLATVFTDRYFCINKEGAEFFTNKFDYISNSSEGLLAAQKGGKFYFYDKTGVKAFDAGFDIAQGFEEGYACVNIGGHLGFEAATLGAGKWGYINKKGEMMLPAVYRNYSEFKDGIALVEKDNREFYIDKNGNDVIKILMGKIKK